MIKFFEKSTYSEQDIFQFAVTTGFIIGLLIGFFAATP